MIECAFPVGALIGVCPEVITQSLYQVGSDAGTAVSVEVFHSIGKSRDGNAFLYSQAYNLAQTFFIGIDLIQEELVEYQVFQIPIFFIGFGDFIEEFSLNDAAGPENRCDTAVVEIPVVRFRCAAIKKILGRRPRFFPYTGCAVRLR